MLEHLRKRLTDRAFSASPEANVPVKCTSERGGSLETNLRWQIRDAGKTIGLAKMQLHQHSVGSKREELEAIVQQEGFDVVTITEALWDDCHQGSAAVAGYKLFRRDRRSRRGGWVALYNRECFDCIEIDDEDDMVECLWVRITGKVSRADVTVGVP